MNDFDLDHELDALADLHEEMVQELDESMACLEQAGGVERAFLDVVHDELGAHDELY